MTATAITLFGILAGSGTIIIVALVGFIGKGIEKRIDILFEELKKYQTKEVCRLISGKNERDINGIGKKIEKHEAEHNGKSA